jgi:hypothetical protein
MPNEFQDFFRSYLPNVNQDHADWMFNRLEDIRAFAINADLMLPIQHKEFLAFGVRHIVEQYQKDFEASSCFSNTQWARKICFALEFARMNNSFDITIEEDDLSPQELFQAMIEQGREDKEKAEEEERIKALCQKPQSAQKCPECSEDSECSEEPEGVDDENAYDKMIAGMFSYQKEIDKEKNLAGLSDRIEKKLLEGTEEESMKSKVERKLREKGIDPDEFRITGQMFQEPKKFEEDPPEEEVSKEAAVQIAREYNALIALADIQNQGIQDLEKRHRQSVRDLAEFIAKMQLEDATSALALFFRRKNNKEI